MKLDNTITSNASPLTHYLPVGSLVFITSLIEKLNLKIKITNSRKTKYGDYKPPILASFHQITVNGDLNPYHFLITFLHELAHLHTFIQHKNNVKPHGKEWKDNFKKLLIFFVTKQVFPDDIAIALKNHLQSIKASTSSDNRLTRALRKYNQNQHLVLEDIPNNSLFKIADGRTFKKGERRRTRYLCLCLDNNKEYLFNPFYQIMPIEH